MSSPGTRLSNAVSETQTGARDRRRRSRHKVHTPAYVSMNSNSTGTVLDLHEILDINEDGMSFQSSCQMDPGQNLNLCIDLSETTAYIHTTARVVWSGDSGRTGARFPNLSEQDLGQLKQWLFANAMVACLNYRGQQAVETPQPSTEESTADSPASTQKLEGRTTDVSSIFAAMEAARLEVQAAGADFEAALRLIVEKVQSLTGATGVAIALADEVDLRNPEMICRAVAGSQAPGLGARLQVGSGFSGECVRTSRLLSCEDSETDPRVDAETCRILGVRSMIAAPIRAGEAVIGLLEVFSPAAKAFSAGDKIILQHMAELVAVQLAASKVPAMHATPKNSAATAVQPEVAPPLLEAEENPPPGIPEHDFSGPAPPEPSHSSRLRGILLMVLAAIVLALVLVWFFAPQLGLRARAPAQAAPQASASAKPLVDIPPNASSIDRLKLLAKSGDASAQFSLGIRYATGEDVPQDYSQAAHWFSLAAEQGNVLAQSNLAAYYWAGRGVPQDMSKAYFWAVLAQAGGDEPSRVRLSYLASRMKRSQILTAEQQANDWIRQHQALATSR